METVAEIQDMRVTELKEFLKRNEFDVSSIQRADGTDGPPRKSDLASAALHLRADYDNPKEDGPLSPSRKSNVFQSGYSPRSPAVQRTKTSPRRGGESSGSEDMNPRRRPGRPAKRPSAVVGTAAAASSSAKKLKPRRRSASWINPAFNLTPGGGTPRKAFTPGRVARRVEVTEQVEEFPVESNEDQLLPSDYDSSGGGLSGVESDGGSVIDTDDDDDSQPNKFRSMKVYEIRAWLNKHDVVFNHRSKKAELISLATGHALYLENMEDKATARSAAKKDWREVEDDDITAAQDDDEVVEVTPAKDSRRYPARKSVETRPTPKSSKKADEVVARSREDSAYRRSRNRVIAAPQPDEDMIEKAEKKPVDDDIVEMKKVKKMKKRHQKKERPAKKRWFRLPTLKMPAMPTMPKITITRRGVLFFLGAIVAALLGFVIFTAYEKSTWPYCDTGSNQGQFIQLFFNFRAQVKEGLSLARALLEGE